MKFLPLDDSSVEVLRSTVQRRKRSLGTPVGDGGSRTRRTQVLGAVHDRQISADRARS
ncbi:hypothetical protein NY08_2759 [Rhodococcus sp. B7740]|nr:hypothetical protein NY08_2759 [Rhodococcus sp. B7740]